LAHTGLQTAGLRASGAHVLKYAALRITQSHRFRLGLAQISMQPSA